MQSSGAPASSSRCRCAVAPRFRSSRDGIEQRGPETIVNVSPRAPSTQRAGGRMSARRRSCFARGGTPLATAAPSGNILASARLGQSRAPRGRGVRVDPVAAGPSQRLFAGNQRREPGVVLSRGKSSGAFVAAADQHHPRRQPDRGRPRWQCRGSARPCLQALAPRGHLRSYRRLRSSAERGADAPRPRSRAGRLGANVGHRVF